MKQYEYVDEYIAQNGDAIGFRFNLASYRGWMEQTYPSQAHKASSQLVAHRQSPEDRTFTTECLREVVDEKGVTHEKPGLGPTAFYRVIETGTGIRPSALLKMHLREAEEMINRWENEGRFRMYSLVLRDKRALAAFELAKAEAKAVAVLLHTRLRYFDEGGPDDDNGLAPA